MVDDEFDRRERIDVRGAATEFDHRIAHGSEINDDGHARKILQDDTTWCEGDFMAGGGPRVPVEQRLDVRARHAHAVFKAQQIFQENLERVGKSIDLGLIERRQGKDVVILAADPQLATGLETIAHTSSGKRIGREGRELYRHKGVLLKPGKERSGESVGKRRAFSAGNRALNDGTTDRKSVV